MRLYLVAYQLGADDLDQLVIARDDEHAIALWAGSWEIEKAEQKNARVFEIKPANISQFEHARVLEWRGADVIEHKPIN